MSWLDSIGKRKKVGEPTRSSWVNSVGKKRTPTTTQPTKKPAGVTITEAKDNRTISGVQSSPYNFLNRPNVSVDPNIGKFTNTSLSVSKAPISDVKISVRKADEKIGQDSFVVRKNVPPALLKIEEQERNLKKLITDIESMKGNVKSEEDTKTILDTISRYNTIQNEYKASVDEYNKSIRWAPNWASQQKDQSFDPTKYKNINIPTLGSAKENTPRIGDTLKDKFNQSGLTPYVKVLAGDSSKKSWQEKELEQAKKNVQKVDWKTLLVVPTIIKTLDVLYKARDVKKAKEAQNNLGEWLLQQNDLVESHYREKRRQVAFKQMGITGNEKLPEDYEEPMHVGGQLIESIVRGYHSAIKPSAGVMAESIGKITGNPNMIKWGEQFQFKSDAYLLQHPELLAADTKRIDLKAAQIVGEMIPFISSVTASTIIGGLVGGPGGAAALGYGSIFAIEKSNAYKNYIDQGMSPREAEGFSNAYGAISAYIENAFGIKPVKIGQSLVGKTSKEIFSTGLKKTLLAELPKIGLNTLMVAIQEGGEEVLQGIVEQLGLKFYDSNANVLEGFRENLEGGFIGGLAFGGAQVLTDVKQTAAALQREKDAAWQKELDKLPKDGFRYKIAEADPKNFDNVDDLTKLAQKYKTKEDFIKANKEGFLIDIKKLEPMSTENGFKKYRLEGANSTDFSKNKIIKEGIESLEPIQLTGGSLKEGNYLVWDGNHRVQAAIESGNKKIKATFKLTDKGLENIYNKANQSQVDDLTKLAQRYKAEGKGLNQFLIDNSLLNTDILYNDKKELLNFINKSKTFDDWDSISDELRMLGINERNLDKVRSILEVDIKSTDDLIKKQKKLTDIWNKANKTEQVDKKTLKRLNAKEVDINDIVVREEDVKLAEKDYDMGKRSMSYNLPVLVSPNVDGSITLEDGYHRYVQAKKLGAKTMMTTMEERQYIDIIDEKEIESKIKNKWKIKSVQKKSTKPAYLIKSRIAGYKENMTKEQGERFLAVMFPFLDANGVKRLKSWIDLETADKVFADKDKKIEVEGRSIRNLIEVVINNGLISDKVLYHESFHTFLRYYLNNKEYRRIIEDTIKNHPKEIEAYKKSNKLYDSDIIAAEEYLADAFADYVKTKKTNFTEAQSLFQKIVSFLRNLWANKVDYPQLFEDAMSGKFKKLSRQEIRENRLFRGEKDAFMAKPKFEDILKESDNIKDLIKRKQALEQLRLGNAGDKSIVNAINKLDTKIKEAKTKKEIVEKPKTQRSTMSVEEFSISLDADISRNEEIPQNVLTPEEEAIYQEEMMSGLYETKDFNRDMKEVIMSLGGIKIDGSEEVAQLPTSMKRKDGLPIDELVSEVNNKLGTTYADSNELTQAILNIKTQGMSDRTGLLNLGAFDVRNTKEVQSLPQKLKNAITFFILPSTRQKARLFGLLGNKMTSIPIFRELFGKWANQGIKTIVEPYGGAFTLVPHSLDKAVENGLKNFYSNVFDKDKFLVIKAIKDGNKDLVVKKYEQAIKKLDDEIIDHAQASGDVEVMKVIEEFKTKYPDKPIGSAEWIYYIKNETNVGARVTVLKDEYEVWRKIFQDSIDNVYSEEIKTLEDAVMKAYINRIGVYNDKGQKFIGSHGFGSFANIVYGNYGIFSALDVIDKSFRELEEKGVNVKLSNMDGAELVNSLKFDNPSEVGWVMDPPYTQTVKTYKNLENADNFLTGAGFVKSHKKAFDSKSKVALTNDVNEDWLNGMINEVADHSIFAYKEGTTPTSLFLSGDMKSDILDIIEKRKQTGSSSIENFVNRFNIQKEMIRSRIVKPYPSPAFIKGKNTELGDIIPDAEIYTYEIYYSQMKLRHQKGDAEKIIGELSNAGVREQVIESIIIDDKYLKNLVKIKREPNGQISTTIDKGVIEYLKKTSNIPNIPDFEMKKLLTPVKNIAKWAVAGYEVPARMFRRLGTGFYNVINVPIREAERRANSLHIELRNKIPTLLELNKQERLELSAYAMQKQGVKNIPSKLLVPLNDKHKQAYKELRNMFEGLYPRVSGIARKTGHNIGRVLNYTPLYKSSDVEILQYGSIYDFTRKDPYFASIKERAEDRIDYKFYEKDIKKTMKIWLDNASRYVEMAEATTKIKYLLDSEEFKSLVPAKIYTNIQEWYKYVVNTPKLTVSEKILRWLRARQSTVILGLRYTVPLKQFLNIIDEWGIVSEVDIAKGMAELKTNKQLSRYIKGSPAITEREITDITMEGVTDVVFDMIKKPTVMTDKLTAKIIKMSVMRKLMNEHRKKGERMDSKTFKKIDKFSTMMVDEIMGALSKSQTPPHLRTELGKNWNMFMSQLIAKAGFHVQNIWAKQNPEMWNKLPNNHKVAVVKSIVGLVLVAMLENLISNLYWEDDPEEFTKETLQSLIGNFPTLGGISYAIFTGQDYEPMPIAKSIGDLFREWGYINQAKTTETRQKHLVALIWAFTGIFGNPRQLRYIIEGVEGNINGYVLVRNQKVYIDGIDKLLVFLKGRYANKEAIDIARGKTSSGGSKSDSSNSRSGVTRPTRPTRPERPKRPTRPSR